MFVLVHYFVEYPAKEKGWNFDRLDYTSDRVPKGNAIRSVSSENLHFYTAYNRKLMLIS